MTILAKPAGRTLARFAANPDGVVAIEFALVVPLLLLIVIGGMSLANAIWKGNLLQEIAQESARCAIRQSQNCTDAAAACAASAFEPRCYVSQVAPRRGVSGLRDGDIVVNRAEMIAGSSFTSVKVNYSSSILGFKITTSSLGAYPN